MLEINGSFQLGTRLEAEAARWISEGRELSNGLRRDIHGLTSVPFVSAILRMSEPFEEFIQSYDRDPTTMSFREMREYVAGRSLLA